jgi:hypothetical protein
MTANQCSCSLLKFFPRHRVHVPALLALRFHVAQRQPVLERQERAAALRAGQVEGRGGGGHADFRDKDFPELRSIPSSTRCLT